MSNISECGIFSHLIEKWMPDGKFDEEAFSTIVSELKPEHLIGFLHALLCTQPAANQFLVDALKLAQDHEWDT